MINEIIDKRLENLRKPLIPFQLGSGYLKKVNCPGIFKNRFCYTSIFRFNNTF